jgi:hypothetical protein
MKMVFYIFLNAVVVTVVYFLDFPASFADEMVVVPVSG